jgi:hypothetical protein
MKASELASQLNDIHPDAQITVPRYNISTGSLEHFEIIAIQRTEKPGVYDVMTNSLSNEFIAKLKADYAKEDAASKD